jgi:hypothetical protein
MAHKPPNHFGRLVCAVVVDDHVHVAVRWQLRIDALEKFKKLLMPMPPMTLADDFPGGDVQRREQRGRPVADVVMRLAGRDAGAHRQERPRPVHGLDLAFFVHR